jgi:hypothetical protein
MVIKVSVLREMTPDEVREKVGAFTISYVTDWKSWIGVAEPIVPPRSPPS